MAVLRSTRPTLSTIAVAGSLVVLLVVSAGGGRAQATPRIGAHDLPTLFYIAKSDDRNRVDYGVRLDASCAPVGDAPVFAYWRRFEPGQPPLGELNFLDARGYGIARQEVRVREANGSWIELGLAALPSHRLLALVQRAGDRCVGAVQTTIRGREAVLDHVFVQLDGPMRIREVVLRGETRTSGEPISERMRP